MQKRATAGSRNVALIHLHFIKYDWKADWNDGPCVSSSSLCEGVGFLHVGLRLPGERSAWDRRNPDHTTGLLLHRRLCQSGWVTLLHRWDWFLWSLKRSCSPASTHFPCTLMEADLRSRMSSNCTTGKAFRGFLKKKGQRTLQYLCCALQPVSRPLCLLATYLDSW